MTLMLTVFLATLAIEGAIYLKVIWKFKLPLAVLALVAIAATLGIALFMLSPILTALMIYIAAYRILNLYKALEGSSHNNRRRITARISYLWLAGAQAVLLTFSFTGYEHTNFLALALALSLVICAVATGLLFYASRSLKRMRLPYVEQNFVSQHLPTVTVAIPARNETDDLEQCLQSLVKNTYPKLEILVLDDCSQNKRTPEIIRQFAHDGVRFIAGDIPGDEWLAKNYAYKRLAAEANGEYLLFCGVDARFAPQTITQALESMLETGKEMVSLVPENTQPKARLKALFIQPFRYAWEVSIPRNWSVRPPTLSTCWIVKEAALASHGGFDAVRQAILPERYLARQIQRDNKYGFYVADESIGLRCQKKFDEQKDTAIRMRYPQLFKRLELLCAYTLISALLVISPYVFILLAVFNAGWFLLALNLLIIVVLAKWYSIAIMLAYRQLGPVGLLVAPFALLYDLYLLHISFWRYEFSKVIWKDRNICIPVMQVYPSLPKIQ